MPRASGVDRVLHAQDLTLYGKKVEYNSLE